MKNRLQVRSQYMMSVEVLHSSCTVRSHNICDLTVHEWLPHYRRGYDAVERKLTLYSGTSATVLYLPRILERNT